MNIISADLSLEFKKQRQFTIRVLISIGFLAKSKSGREGLLFKEIEVTEGIAFQIRVRGRSSGWGVSRLSGGGGD